MPEARRRGTACSHAARWGSRRLPPLLWSGQAPWTIHPLSHAASTVPLIMGGCSREHGALPFVRDIVPQHSQFREGIVGVAMPQFPDSIGFSGKILNY